MSRRWPVYEAAQAKRAEEQKLKDENLRRVLANQARLLSKGKKNGGDEVSDEQIGGGRREAAVAERPAQNADGGAKVQPVSRSRPGPKRKNVERQSHVGA